jgi:hypothetical protein
VYKWRRAKTPQDRVVVGRNVGALITLMVVAGATADELKDFLFRREAKSFGDNVHENFLKIFFMNRYSLDQGKGKGFVDMFLNDFLIPPTGPVDYPLKDIYSIFSDEKKFENKSVELIPHVRWMKALFSDDTRTKEMDKVKSKIRENIRSGESISDNREMINKYNKFTIEYNRTVKTKEERKKPLDLSELNKLRQEAKRTQRE